MKRDASMDRVVAVLQVRGTHHIRLTILPPEADIDTMLGHLSHFHNAFMTGYSSDAARATTTAEQGTRLSGDKVQHNATAS